MTDLICFKVNKKGSFIASDDGLERSTAEHLLHCLKRDFYNDKNPQAIASPFYVDDGKDEVLFFCPIILIVGGFVGRFVKDAVIKGFKSSFSKAGIKIEAVRVNKRMEDRYELAKPKA